ncbi:MAG TPA: hypothetical protein VL068_09425 [Microthrixaceae bacterium]|nr:hypothetical protein [Microthrixaceae bacterium]
MHSDPADPYRDALYAAEDEALPDGGRRFTRFASIEKFVGEVISDPFWEMTFPDAPVEVEIRRRSRGATFSAAHVAEDGQAAVLFIRDGSWTMAVVVHELAHVASFTANRTDGSHGPEFAAALLKLWRKYLGMHAYGALRSALDGRDVPYRRARRG